MERVAYIKHCVLFSSQILVYPLDGIQTPTDKKDCLYIQMQVQLINYAIIFRYTENRVFLYLSCGNCGNLVKNNSFVYPGTEVVVEIFFF